MPLLPETKTRWISLLPIAFVIAGMPILVFFTNSRFPNTGTGDLYRLLAGLISSLVLGALGYLVARSLSR